jgi:hypothetical protein
MATKFEDVVLPIDKPVEEQLQWALGRIDELERFADYHKRDLVSMRERQNSTRRLLMQAKAQVAELEWQREDDRARERADIAYLEGKVRRQRVRLRQLEELRLAESERAKIRWDLATADQAARGE